VIVKGMTSADLVPLFCFAVVASIIYLMFYYEAPANANLRSLAEAGDVNAMIALAKRTAGIKERMVWYRLAADAGSTFGMVMYADYVSGLPDKHDVAFRYYLMAANEGVPEAMAEIAEGYANGHGVMKNIGSAAEWREKAAKKGHRASQVELAKALFSGHGLPPQPVEGLAWLYLAEHNKALEAIVLVAEFESVARSYPSTTPNQIILEAQNRAKQLVAENPSALDGR
jgi:TPR repeat protein